MKNNGQRVEKTVDWQMADMMLKKFDETQRITNAIDIACALKLWFAGDLEQAKDYFEELVASPDWASVWEGLWMDAKGSPEAAARVRDYAESRGYRDAAAQALREQEASQEEERGIIDAVQILIGSLKAPIRSSRGEVFIYGDGIWMPTGREGLAQKALEILPHAMQSARSAEAVVDTLICQMYWPGSWSAAIRFGEGNKSVLVCCANGVLKVTSEGMELLPYSPDYGFRNKIKARYNPKAKCDLFDEMVGKFLPRTLKAGGDPDLPEHWLYEDQDRLMWVAGWLLYPSLSHKMSVVAYGLTDCGKTSIFEYGFGSVFDASQKTNLSLTDICKEPAYSLPSLEFSLLNLGGELNTTEVTDSAHWKQLSSGDPIGGVRNIRQAPFEMKGYVVKTVFLSNHLPRFQNGTNAETNRMRLIHFHHAISKEDKDPMFMDRVASSDCDGIFTHWMIAGLQQVLSGAIMPEGSAETRQLMATFAESNDPDDVFIRTCCNLGKNYSVGRKAFKKAYSKFIEDLDKSIKTTYGAMNRLVEKYSLQRAKIGMEGHRTNVYKGVSLKPEYMPSAEEMNRIDNDENEKE